MVQIKSLPLFLITKRLLYEQEAQGRLFDYINRTDTHNDILYNNSHCNMEPVENLK